MEITCVVCKILLTRQEMEKTKILSRHIRDPHPDGACHLVRMDCLLPKNQ